MAPAAETVGGFPPTVEIANRCLGLIVPVRRERRDRMIALLKESPRKKSDPWAITWTHE